MKQKMSLSFKQATVVEAALNKPSEVSLEQFAKERGLGYSTVQRWLRLARDGKLGALPTTTPVREKGTAEWSADEKWQAVLDCAGKDDVAKAAYCRERGLFHHHVDQWKHELMVKSKSNDPVLRNGLRALKDENKQLKRELARKEKALADDGMDAGGRATQEQLPRQPR